MILLNTHVISEPLKLTGDVGVMTWIDAQIIETLYLSTISLAELRFGIAALAPGKQRDTLHASLEQRILPFFAGWILPFDADASKAYAVLCARARAQVKAIAPADGNIAATATRHGLIVATRDTGPFEAAGLSVINPWNTQHWQHSVGEKKGLETDHVIGRSRGGLTTKIHTTVDALGNLTGFHLTAGQAHDWHGRRGFIQRQASPSRHCRQGAWRAGAVHWAIT